MNPKHLLILFALVLSLALLSCSNDDKESDPTPEQADTNMAKVKKGILGKWILQQTVVSKGSETVTYKVSEGESGLPEWAQKSVGQVDFNFIDTLFYLKSVGGIESNAKEFYHIRERNNVFTLRMQNGIIADTISYQILTDVKDISGSVLDLKQLDHFNYQVATAATLTFNRK